MYKTPDKTYRDIIKENKDINLNSEGDLESQKIIRDALIDQAINNADEDFCIHDRCVLDNLVYTLWLGEQGKISDADFIADSFHITRETLKMYDIIFLLPLDVKSPVVLEEREDRELDLKYRTEINNIFLGINSSYKEREGLVFPIKDSPALIEIYGDEENFEKTDMVAQYIDEDGTFNNSDENLMKTISEAAQEEALAQTLLNQVS